MSSSEKEHALLSASTSERWLNCPRSARLWENEAKTESKYAKEGTEAHALAEIKLSFILGKINNEQYKAKFDDFLMTSAFYNSEMNDFVNDFVKEVMDIVTQDYQGQEVIVRLECKVDYSDIAPEGRGTSDVVIVGKDFVHVIDLKYGKGVAVSAIGNSQLRLYALGTIKKFIRECQCKEVRMTIIQPRLYDKTTDFMSINDINAWAVDYVKPRAELAYSGRGDMCPGDWCKFCPGKGKCNTLGSHQMEVAQAEFNDIIVVNNILKPEDMTPEMLSRIMAVAPKFIDWFKDVQKFAVASMINNDLKIPGYKVVEGKSTRIITSPDQVSKILQEKGYSENELTKPAKLLGITALEKVVGKKLFNNLCSEYIVKPSGKPTVAVETDNRPALDTATFKLMGQEFEDDETEEDE